jgi:Protein of unknown function (DUF1761)
MAPRSRNQGEVALSRLIRELNWLSVLAGALAYFVLGAAWGSSPLGQRYYEALGFSPPPGWTPGTAMYVGPLLGALAASVATALLARATQASTLRDGLALGLVVGIGYGASISGMDAAAPHNAMPGTLFAILAGYHLLSLMVVGAIVAVWRKR